MNLSSIKTKSLGVNRRIRSRSDVIQRTVSDDIYTCTFQLDNILTLCLMDVIASSGIQSYVENGGEKCIAVIQV